MDETQKNAIAPVTAQVADQSDSPPLVREFASLRAYKPGERAAWKDMAQAAEAELIEPRFALEEMTDRYILKALIPGGHDVAVKVTSDAPHTPRQLVITGATDERFTNGDTFGYVRRRPIYASFTLPLDADEQNVQSAMRHSILHVTIPRTACVPI